MAKWIVDKWWKKTLYIMGWIYLIEIILAFMSGYIGGSLGII